MQMCEVELIMSEFGDDRVNCGGADLPSSNRLNPTLDSFLKLLPFSKVTLYTDTDIKFRERVNVIRVDPPFDKRHPRYGWRAHDYYQAKGLLESTANIAIAMDSDMVILNEKFLAILKIAEKFGLAVPVNSRILVGIDGTIGVDSTYEPAQDDCLGLAFAYNLTPIAFSTKNHAARQLLELYCELMVARPGRGGIHLFNAAYTLGINPYLLPPQWCVCAPRDLDSPHLWSAAVALHVGHVDVLPRWENEMRKKRVKSWIKNIVRKING